jgi:Ca2+/H+ antiporter
MAAKISSYLIWWTAYVPVLAVAALVLTWGRELSPPIVALTAILLAAEFLAAVHHAEVVAMIWLPGPLLLGLGATQMVLLALTVVVGTLTVVPGRATVLQGGVHLALLARFSYSRPARSRPGMGLAAGA